MHGKGNDAFRGLGNRNRSMQNGYNSQGSAPNRAGSTPATRSTGKTSETNWVVQYLPFKYAAIRCTDNYMVHSNGVENGIPTGAGVNIRTKEGEWKCIGARDAAGRATTFSSKATSAITIAEEMTKPPSCVETLLSKAHEAPLQKE
mmetsp:Transcript_24961/g.43101  ORF Transcript_24961/g.43101 Transcript_24961/m.43101 type:complete len:146 (-) Transcript_24961:101-538(-)